MSKNMQLAEQALWAVANIAGDSAQLRDFVIRMYYSFRLPFRFLGKYSVFF